jgi:hypothetical protein
MRNIGGNRDALLPIFESATMVPVSDEQKIQQMIDDLRADARAMRAQIESESAIPSLFERCFRAAMGH